MEAPLLIIVAWLVLVNVWHLYLVAEYGKKYTKPTLSETAAQNRRMLNLHRAIHIAPVFVFMPAVLGYFLPERHLMTGLLLLAGATFDVIQVVSLNEKTAPLKAAPNTHYVSSWLMAISYFIFTALMCSLSDIGFWICAPLLFTAIVLAVFSGNAVSRGISLPVQFLFFFIVSLTASISLMGIIMQ